MKKLVFWICVLNIVLTLVLLGIEFKSPSFGARISGLCGWVVAAIHTAG